MGDMKWLAVILCLSLLLCGCGREVANVPDFVLTYADNQPESYPTTRAAQRFAELVQQRTDGKVVIQVKANGEFGSEQDILEQMAFGGVDFCRVSLSAISDELPVMNVLQLPFLYRDAEHMWQVLDGDLGERFLELFSEAGLVGLSWYDAGARSFYCDGSPIRQVSDLQGRRVRVQNSQMLVDMVTLLGGVPVTMAYSDVYDGFRRDKIDVAENNWPSYEVSAHYEVAEFFTLDEHTRVPEAQLASGRTWEALPEEYRAIIAQCARESALYQRQIWVEQEVSSRTYAKERGCQEIVLTDDALAEFRQTVYPLYEIYCGEYLDLIDQIQSCRSQDQST